MEQLQRASYANTLGKADGKCLGKFRIGLAETLGGHHGIFPSNQEVNDYNGLTVLIENKTWQSLQWEIFNRLETTIYPNRPLKYPSTRTKSMLYC